MTSLAWERSARGIGACAWLAIIGMILGCGAEPDAADPASSHGPGAGGSEGGSNADGGAAVGAGGRGPNAGPGAGPGGAGGGVGSGGSAPQGLADVGTLVVLGDSIGDGGGQPPFYYNLLRTQLETRYGHPIAYFNHAESGSKTGALVGQIGSLPGNMTGPVAVAVTSGGNDMKDAIGQILTGTDAPARTAMGDHVDAALDALLEPDRFGPGVEVHVFEADIYDASDGQGNFGSHGCNISIDSPISTDPAFASWNGEIATRVAGHAQVLAPMHDHFYGHGFNHPPSWYASDCTHPNTTGHAELADLFTTLIAGP
jgi:GDSL-like lipase/acylhydrolase family protein